MTNKTNRGGSLECQCQFYMQLGETTLPVIVAASVYLLETKEMGISISLGMFKVISSVISVVLQNGSGYHLN